MYVGPRSLHRLCDWQSWAELPHRLSGFLPYLSVPHSIFPQTSLSSLSVSREESFPLRKYENVVLPPFLQDGMYWDAKWIDCHGWQQAWCYSCLFQQNHQIHHGSLSVCWPLQCTHWVIVCHWFIILGNKNAHPQLAKGFQRAKSLPLS